MINPWKYEYSEIHLISSYHRHLISANSGSQKSYSVTDQWNNTNEPEQHFTRRASLTPREKNHDKTQEQSHASEMREIMQIMQIVQSTGSLWWSALHNAYLTMYQSIISKLTTNIYIHCRCNKVISNADPQLSATKYENSKTKKFTI